MAFKSGTIIAASGSGSEDLGFEPQGMLCFGSNFTAEDVMTATSFPALGFGMAWKDWNTGALDQQSVANSMLHGINVKPAVLVMPQTQGCTEAYRLAITSLNATGFSYSFSNVTVSGCPVHYLAWGEFDGAGGTPSNSGTFNVPYRALTGIGFNYRTSGGIRDGCENGNYNTMYVGGANWPDEEDPPTHNNRTWGTVGFSRLITIAANGFVAEQANFAPSPQFQSAINFTTGDFPPIVNENRGYMWRNASEDVQISMGGGPLRFYGQWWTGEGYHNFVPTAGTFTAPMDIEAAWFAGAIGSTESGLSTSSRMMVGVLTPEHQAVCAASREGGGWAFQSRDMCIVSNFDETSGGLHASSGEIVAGEIETEVEIATAAAGSAVAFTYGDDEDHQQFFRIT